MSSQSAHTYQHRPRPFSNALELTLRGATLEAIRGAKEHSFALSEVESLRLTYKPANTARLGFSCLLRMKDARSLTFTNLDWRSMVENAPQHTEYAAFVRALVQGVARANPRAQLLAGLPGWRHVAFGAGALVLLPALALSLIYLLGRSQWALGVLALALLGWLAFYAFDYWQRNRPRAFTPEAIPPAVLPPEG